MIRHGAGGYGVDIGCGMIAVRTQFTGDDITRRGHLAALREAIEDAIPLSAGFYSTSISRAHTTARVGNSNVLTAQTARTRPLPTGGCSLAASAPVTTSSR